MNNSLRSWLSSFVDFNTLGGVSLSDLSHLVIDLFISDVCNLKCRHCYFGDTSTLGKALDTSEWESIITDLYQRGVRHFHISGRESSLDERVPTIVAFLTAFPGVYTGLVSNGTGPLSFYQSVLDNGIDYLEFSLDGLEATHDYQRRGPVFSKVISLLRDLISYSNKIDISTCLNIHSIKEYFELVEQCYDIGVRKFYATPFYEKGRGRDFSYFSIEPEDYSLLMEHTLSFFQKHEGSGIVIKYCIPHDMTYTLIQNSSFFKNSLTDFLKGKSNLLYRVNGNTMQLGLNLIDIDYVGILTVTNDGEVIPCADDICVKDYNTIGLGNIITDGLDSILSKREEHILNSINTLNTIAHGN